MMAPGTQPLLVSGAHRTGTTWVGRLLAASPGMAYLSEPLNVLHRPGVFSARVVHWYKYICSENAREFLPAFRELMAYRYHLLAELRSIRSLHDSGRMFRDLGIFIDARLWDRRPLLKDPFAVFSLRWFADVLNCRVVVTIRHPAAFASGLKRLNWTFDFSHLLQQPLLMRDHLGEYRAAMQSDAAQDVIGQAGLLWAMIYASVQRLKDAVPGLVLVRHEDLAMEPVSGFKGLYRQLGLEFTPRVEAAVLQASSAENPVELGQRSVHSVRMDSRASLGNWKRRLTREEVMRLRRLTDGVVQLYYPEESWN